MAVSNETMRTLLDRPIDLAGYRETIIVGNLSIAAMRYLESRGTCIEEKDELFYITLPREADVQLWQHDASGRITIWAVTFDDEGDVQGNPGTMHVIVESELISFESRCYALPI